MKYTFTLTKSPRCPRCNRRIEPGSNSDHCATCNRHDADMHLISQARSMIAEALKLEVTRG